MIYFSQRRKLGEMYKQWIIENHIYDCPSSVVDFLQVKGLLDEKKTYEFLAVKTSSLIDDEGIRQENYFKEETIMANKNDTQENKDTKVPAVPDGDQKTPETKKENVFKRAAKATWHGVCKVGRAIKESPWTHFATAAVGAGAVIAVEEVCRRKFSGSDDTVEDLEPIEAEFPEETEEEPDIGPTEDDDDEVTE